MNEQLVLRGCDQGIPPHDVIPPPCDGREDTDCALWLAMQLVHIDSEARKRSRWVESVFFLFEGGVLIPVPPTLINRSISIYSKVGIFFT